ncbi:MAG TPA: SpoIIE family protein phosphatase [Vicinamibacterales bacterium]|nr:SpoIIE family protein phosphatase [Vicinamibacterales bacterium]
MTQPRLSVTDPLGTRTLPLEVSTFTIGRRGSHHLSLAGSDTSRDHAEIAQQDGRYVLRDLGSRYGTFVNGEQVTERELRHGDRLRFGISSGLEVVFLTDEGGPSIQQSAASAASDLRRMATLLETLRSLGGGRVLDEVLQIVLDSAIDVTAAERGFIMLADRDGRLEFKLGRARGRVSLSGQRFATSRKIPEDVFATGDARLVSDLLDGDLAAQHEGTIAVGIRHVLCVPLDLIQYVETSDGPLEPRRIGVLYLDSRERGALLSSTALSALETLAHEAAVAIEHARLYRESEAKARLDRELAIAAEIQQALLPHARRTGAHFDAIGTSIPCRAIGGDFFDYVDQPSGAFGLALGDVAGKGPPAALLTAMLQGMLEAHAGAVGPAATMARINEGLIRRAVSARYATAFYGVLASDGRFTYCNAGHNPPFLMSAHGSRRLETGGPVVGLLPGAPYEEEIVVLAPGDLLVVFSDGISEAFDAAGDDFGDDRILQVVEAHAAEPVPDLMAALLEAVRAFCIGAMQSDDQTVVLLRYLGEPARA